MKVVCNLLHIINNISKSLNIVPDSVVLHSRSLCRVSISIRNNSWRFFNVIFDIKKKYETGFDREFKEVTVSRDECYNLNKDSWIASMNLKSEDLDLLKHYVDLNPKTKFRILSADTLNLDFEYKNIITNLISKLQDCEMW
jgi:hypothetical protein